MSKFIAHKIIHNLMSQSSSFGNTDLILLTIPTTFGIYTSFTPSEVIPSQLLVYQEEDQSSLVLQDDIHSSVPESSSHSSISESESPVLQPAEVDLIHLTSSVKEGAQPS
ncbi:hypothetical protein NC652_004203 [Populus alba x Populus x berolinensis]|nr:hypothetical protein NC652_004203 [Populus alba x Populus x berolinensis]